MASLTSKQLTAIEKSMTALIDGDETKTAEVHDAFEKFRKALGDGEAVTADEVDDLLTEVMVGKANEDDSAGDAEPTDPFAPIFKTLYDELAKTGIAKSAKGEAALQAVFEKAYTAVLAQVDGVIEQTVEATADQLAKVGKGKKPMKKPPTEDDEDCDEGDEAMEKILKKFGASSPIIMKKMADLTAEVAELRHDKELGLFAKRAEKAGAPEMAEDLLAMHKFSPELATRMEKRLQAQHQLLLKSNTWSAELGSDAEPSGNNAYDQLKGFASEIQKGATGKMSFSKAFTLACEQHPDVYAQHRAESN